MSLATPDKKISEQLQSIAEGLNKILEEVAGQRMSFSLVVFNAEAGSRMNYVSNRDRADVAAAMKSLIKGWEEGMPDIKAHKLDS